MDDLIFMKPQSQLAKFLKVPQVRETFMALRRLCVIECDEEELEAQVSLTCAEAVRYAYKMSRELGIDKETFLGGLDKVMEVEDADYRIKNYH